MISMIYWMILVKFSLYTGCNVGWFRWTIVCVLGIVVVCFVVAVCDVVHAVEATMAFLECWRRLGVFSGIWGMPVKLQFAVSRASLMFRRGFPDVVGK